MLNRKLMTSSAVVTATLSIASPTHASPELATLAQVQWGNNPQIDLNTGSVTLENGTTVTGTTTATNTQGFSDSNASFSGTANANANFGVLGVFADASASNTTYLISLASGTAGFTDTMTITGGTGDSSTNFTFHISGSSTFTGDGSVLVLLGAFRTDTLEGDIDLHLNSGDFDLTTSDISFTYNVPFEFTVILSVHASFIPDFLNSQFTASGTATGMFDHTVTLTGVSVLNNQSFSLTSGSGTSYPISGNLPEPNTFALLAIGSIACFRRRHD